MGVQIQSGVGIDLTKASIGIILSTGYSNADYEQAIARIYRLPQARPVRIIHIECKNTIDQDVSRALQNKADVVAALRKSEWNT